MRTTREDDLRCARRIPIQLPEVPERRFSVSAARHLVEPVEDQEHLPFAEARTGTLRKKRESRDR